MAEHNIRELSRLSVVDVIGPDERKRLRGSTVMLPCDDSLQVLIHHHGNGVSMQMGVIEGEIKRLNSSNA